mmetsp:Transcript_8024/g.12290  ORF Transcript_8024/g.12290 Transcript_8024/m.12290 type:complete len:243 (-) Transcript_8024:29-757(-)
MQDCLVKHAKTSRLGVVLMIHGWAQNPVVMSLKTRKLAKKLNQAGYDCIFLQAPNRLPMKKEVDNKGNIIGQGGRENAYAWFVYNRHDPSDSSRGFSGECIEYFGLEKSLTCIGRKLEILKEEVTDGTISVLGFSQGAVFCHILASLSGHKVSPFEAIQKCVLVSGFPATPRAYSLETLSNIPIQSLHLYGSEDTRVPPSRSIALKSRFLESIEIEHDGGHVLPQQSARCTAIIEFLKHGKC